LWLSTSISKSLLQEIHFYFVHPLLCLTIFFHAHNIVKACQSSGHHILALEPNMEVFSKVLTTFVVVDMFDPKFDHIHTFDIDFQETFQKDVWLILSSCLICIMLYPPKSLPFSRPNDLFRDPSTNFVLPSYVEAQARALTSLPSLPRILSCGYDLGVKKKVQWWNIGRCVGLKFELRGGSC
jgi:hypothetical protein